MNLKGLLLKLKSEAFITPLSASFLLSTTLLFFSPATLYFTNIYEFYYTFSDIFPFICILTIITGILLAFLLVSLKGNYSQKCVCIVFCLGVLFYIQGNILVWDYGPLNGQEIIWNKYFINGILDLLIWIVIFSVAFLKSEKIYKIIPLVSLFLIIIQIGGIIALVYSAPPESQWKSNSFENADSQFAFSENENVILIVLDTFQSDVFQEIINEDESYRKLFDGFTYYRNAVGGYPRTAASVPLILTGVYYENEIPFNTFVRQSINNSSLPKTLLTNGFTVDIYDNFHIIFPDKKIASNVQENSFDPVELNTLYKITLFRSVPHFIKESTYNLLIIPDVYDEWKSDLIFFNNITTQTKISRQTPVFKFYHLNGPHYPFFLNESVRYEELPDNRYGYKEQSKASLKIAGHLLTELKNKGIFDKSLIIIIGDHGMQNRAYGINTAQLSQNNFIAYAPDSVISGGLPLILIKPFYSNASLTNSDAPVSLSDIPKTVVTELKIPDNFPGESMLNISESDIRERKYYHYSWENGALDGKFFPPLNEYLITNFSWYGNSWQPTYRIYSSQGITIDNPPAYTVNSTIKIGKNQGTETFLSVGWSRPEDYYAWSEEKISTIAFSMNKTDSDLLFKARLFPLRIKNIYETQRVFVFLNKKELGNFTLSKDEESEKLLFVPHTYLNDQIQYFSFYFPDAKSPSELGVSDDERKIAIGLRSFTIEPLNTSSIFLNEGWSSPENWSGLETYWINNESSFLIYSENDRTTTMSIQASSFNRPRNLLIYVNDQPSKSMNVSTNFDSILIPLNLHQGKNSIQLQVQGICEKPVDIPPLNSDDDRCLSVAVQNVKLLSD